MQSMHDILRRRAGIRNTAQLTRAMGLVSTVKFQKTRRQAEDAGAYLDNLYEAIKEVIPQIESVSLKGKTKKLVIAITSDRGLVGAYHQNIIRCLAQSGFERETLRLIVVGQKGRELFNRRGYSIEEAFDHPTVKSDRDLAEQIEKKIWKEFETENSDEVYLIYTRFIHTVKQEARLLKLFPLEKEEREAQMPMNFEPSIEEVKKELLSIYLTGMIRAALLSSAASEHSARMQAMDAASRNAKELLDNLELQYNRVRQSAITQELTEIIAGFNG